MVNANAENPSRPAESNSAFSTASSAKLHPSADADSSEDKHAAQ